MTAAMDPVRVIAGAPLTPDSASVRDFVAACQENRNLAHGQRGPSGTRIVVELRRKYLAIDEIHTFEGRDCPGQSGRFLVDRQTGDVFSIRGYGQRGYRLGTLAGLADKFRAGSATFTPEACGHWETGRAHVAQWPRAETPAPVAPPAQPLCGCPSATEHIAPCGLAPLPATCEACGRLHEGRPCLRVIDGAAEVPATAHARHEVAQLGDAWDILEPRPAQHSDGRQAGRGP